MSEENNLESEATTLVLKFSEVIQAEYCGNFGISTSKELHTVLKDGLFYVGYHQETPLTQERLLDIAIVAMTLWHRLQ